MKKISLVAFAFIALAGCTNSRKSQVTARNESQKPADTSAQQEPMPYHASATRSIDILHTKLEVNFDWEKQYMNGKAFITLKPYFYPTNEITLDAKGFEMKGVSLQSNPVKTLVYKYDKEKLSITLDREYTRNDSLKILIEYIAKPNERETTPGQAITSDKGLYFINPLGKEKDKPTEIWTQGEPESNSCWFPTFDKPNERMTHEIYITIDSAHKNFVTLSNGLMLSSKKNPDGSRTDYWKQSLPSAPYLVMMAIGDYAIVKDKWKNMEVSYYVEHEYEPYTKLIFGNTPEMIEFFSNKLGTPYPWEKFSQVVVRDYVSGAMENTSAVIHGEFLNQTDREILDNSYEDVISHELFHHWFGDYVTCEQWSDITLNEGFATYGEYLWQEYKYGRDVADQHARESMQGYISSGEKTPKHLIRYYYNEPDDVFDAHSYNKGGAAIHMLRKYIGDDAFFTGLKLYLEKYKFSSVEADNLRLTFELVTGEDLKWFFNQWFYSQGHPKLLIQHAYIDSSKKYLVRVEQKQDLTTNPLFKLPIDIDIYIDGKKERKRVWASNQREEFLFPLSHKPDFVNVDAEKSLLCTKEEKLSIQERAFQYKNCPLFQDRLEALKECSSFTSIPEAADIILAALNDKNPDMRERAINYVEKLPVEYKAKAKNILIDLAKGDAKSSVRALATESLSENFPSDDLLEVYRNGVSDKSFAVAGASLSAIAKKDKKEAMDIAKKFESEKSMDMLIAIAQIYAANGSDANNTFFVKLSSKMSGWENVSFVNTYTEFLKRCSDDTINAGIKILEKIARSDENRWVRYFGQKGIKDLAQMYADREKIISEQIATLKPKQSNSPELKSLEQQLTQAQNQKQKLTSLYNSVMTPN